MQFMNQVKKSFNELLKDAKTFGLTLLGDGATIKRMPLINIIASGVYCPVAVLSIADCTNHMAKGGMKDADYIANTLFLPQFETINPEQTHRSRFV